MNLREYLQQKRGRNKQMADQLQLSPSYTCQLSSGQSPLSPARAVQIEHITHGQVTRRDLFPNNWQDIWPELSPSSSIPKESL
ncbi:YdaS family helix-turn-helix protein [Neisseriaceae bacterium TC5R-5]|nr:YdaS family helix-turn-helix protein [Neisseriaceae bacterium TC5R-5]